MGREARARGTFEQRKAIAIERDAELRRQHRERIEARRAAMSQEEIRKEERARNLLFRLFSQINMFRGL